jgi:ribosomal protein S18 acetylase RimI-like enzyme
MSHPALTLPAGVQLVAAEAQHVSELGRICYEAFKDIADRHGFTPDFPSVQYARTVIGMLVERKDSYGVAAIVNGELAGSNYLSLTDAVAGVGPITVDCAFQGRDLGRALMQDVIDYARRNNIARVRLLQDAFNTASLSLYGSLGFDVKHAVAEIHLNAAVKADATVRPVHDGDIEALDAICQKNYKTSRKNELAAAVRAGLSPVLRERGGRFTGYLVPGLFGHGVAETTDDAVALATQAARLIPHERARSLVPLKDGPLFRAFLKAGCRTVKMMNLMATGPYEEPESVWMPSVLY